MHSRDVLSRAAHATVILIAALTAPVFGSTRPMSDEELVRSSSVVVDARVQRLTPHWNEDHSLIFTTVELDVSRTVYSRGPSGFHALQVEVLGGELDGVGLLLTETPVFQLGERVLVYARPWTNGR